jgi:septum formation protein
MFLKKVVLASASPRRKLLLQQMGLDFKSSPADISEDLFVSVSPPEMAQTIAYRKARTIAAQLDNELVIGADTVVALGNTVLGKPLDRQDAFDMLSRLSGQNHQVFTGLCVIDAETSDYDLAVEETRVHFRPLSVKDINNYLDWAEWTDKAGAYGIQGRGALLVELIQGCFYNVVGLPLNRLNLILRKYGIDLLE